MYSPTTLWLPRKVGRGCAHCSLLRLRTCLLFWLNCWVTAAPLCNPPLLSPAKTSSSFSPQCHHHHHYYYQFPLEGLVSGLCILSSVMCSWLECVCLRYWLSDWWQLPRERNGERLLVCVCVSVFLDVPLWASQHSSKLIQSSKRLNVIAEACLIHLFQWSLRAVSIYLRWPNNTAPCHSADANLISTVLDRSMFPSNEGIE